MGRNNFEQRTNDINWGKNLTKNVPFKFEIMSEELCRRFELSQGLEMHKLTLTIKINCRYKIEIKDKLDIKGRSYMVVAIGSNYDKGSQQMFKGNINDFAGYTILGLE